MEVSTKLSFSASVLDVKISKVEHQIKQVFYIYVSAMLKKKIIQTTNNSTPLSL